MAIDYDRLASSLLALADETDDGSDVGTAPSRSTAALRRQIATLQDEVDGLKNRLQMSSILPLLTTNKMALQQALPVSVDVDGTGKALGSGRVQAGVQIDMKPTDTLMTLLPLLLSGGFGDGSSSDNSMMMLVLALSLSNP